MHINPLLISSAALSTVCFFAACSKATVLFNNKIKSFVLSSLTSSINLLHLSHIIYVCKYIFPTGKQHSSEFSCLIAQVRGHLETSKQTHIRRESTVEGGDTQRTHSAGTEKSKSSMFYSVKHFLSYQRIVFPI